MAQPRPETGYLPNHLFQSSATDFHVAHQSSCSLTTSSNPQTASKHSKQLDEEDLEGIFHPTRVDSGLENTSFNPASDSATSSDDDSGVVSGDGYLADIESELDESILIVLQRSPTEAERMQNGNGEAKDPSSFLTEIIGGKVMVKLNSGIVYKGELQSVDGYMNIALENCKEFVGGKQHRDYGDVFLRGNNVMYICAD